MSFRSLWVLLGIPLVVVGLAADVPIITGIGLIITVAIALSRLWSRRLFNRLNLNIKTTILEFIMRKRHTFYSS